MYNNLNVMDDLGEKELNCPYDNQYILRMIVKIAHSDLLLPSELEWTRSLVEEAIANQEVLGIFQPFCYITVRRGLVQSVNDDEWHVDGFSTKITHLPEQNYIISDCYPTEYVEKKFHFPNDFNPLVHNVHLFFQDNIVESDVKVAKVNHMYACDPYNVHKRQNIPNDVMRTFLRISFTPIEIMDDANTPNPLLPMRDYKRDGVEIRNQLKRYSK